MIVKTITTDDQLLDNLRTIDTYLTSKDDETKKYAIDRVKRGTCFVVDKVKDAYRFYPSRFVGYIDNSIQSHENNPDTDGRVTNRAIDKVLETKPIQSEFLEAKYKEYCNRLGASATDKGAFGVPRKFWTLMTIDFEYKEKQIDNDTEFPEGKLVERKHKARERNSKVIDVAKNNFKSQHGRLFCKVCGFDFEENYGGLGMDFIEGHHTLPVSAMEDNHKTRPDDIAIVCSNCHRMLHKRRPWLELNELKKIIKTAGHKGYKI